MFHMQKHSVRFMPGVVVASLLAGSGPLSAAAPAPASESIIVSARGLDLRSPDGARRLRHRVVVAAHKMCAMQDFIGTIGSDGFTDCVTDSVYDAMSLADAMIAEARHGAPDVVASSTR